MGRFGDFFRRVGAKIKGVVTKVRAAVPKAVSWAKTALPKLQGFIGQAKAFVDGMPDNVKGPIMSALNIVENVSARANGVIEKMEAAGGNAGAAGESGEVAQAEQEAPAAAAA